MTEDVELERTDDADMGAEPVWLEELRADLQRASAVDLEAKPPPPRGRLLRRLFNGR